MDIRCIGEDFMGRTVSRNNQDYRDPYIQGNTVRKMQPMREVPERQEEIRRPSTSIKTRRNRERALQMNFAYVLFLTGAAVLSLFVCVNFLQLQSESTANRKAVTALETELSDLKLENDTAYEHALNSLDLEYIKNVALNELGMIYAGEGQVVTYASQDSDYVRQYEDVPTE